MNEEEKKAIEKFENLLTKHFEDKKIDTLDYLDYFEGITILNLIEKQQKEIDFYKMQELEYIAGYEDGKRRKQTAVAIKNENAQYELIRRVIEKKDKEIEKLKSRKYVLNAETNEIKEIPSCDDYISKAKIREIISKYVDIEEHLVYHHQELWGADLAQMIKELLGE